MLSRMLRFTFAPDRTWREAGGAATQGSVLAYFAVLAVWPACVAALLTVLDSAAGPATPATPLAPGSPYALALGDILPLPAIPVSSIADRASPLVTAAATLVTYCATWVAAAFAATVLWLLAPLFSRRARFRDCFTVVAYGATPLLVSSPALLHASLAPVVALAAMHACYVAWLGATPVLGIRRGDAGVYIGIAIIASLVLSQVAGYGAGTLVSAWK